MSDVPRMALPTAPARRAKADYTFKDDKLIEIGRENMHLLERIAAVATRREELTTARLPPAPRVSTHTINRRKAADSIQKENMRLLSKLQSTKSTLKKAMKAPPTLAKRPHAYSARPSARAAEPEERPPWVDVTAAPPISASWAASAAPARPAAAAAPKRVSGAGRVAKEPLTASRDDYLHDA